MRKLLIIALVILVALLAVAPALAHTASPCNDSGDPGNSDYAQHHIKPLATTGGLGHDGHVPGAHHGYSLCIHSG
ncbi:MAG: hypothetical protein RRC07_02245 [Anaerolineae bacterium]|nr:hypothetical protein [Anaerolineae bacterium]